MEGSVVLHQATRRSPQQSRDSFAGPPRIRLHNHACCRLFEVSAATRSGHWVSIWCFRSIPSQPEMDVDQAGVARSRLSARVGPAATRLKKAPYVFVLYDFYYVTHHFCLGGHLIWLSGREGCAECAGSIGWTPLFVSQPTGRFVAHALAVTSGAPASRADSMLPFSRTLYACAPPDCQEPSLYWLVGGRRTQPATPNAHCGHSASPVGEQSLHARWHPIGHAQSKMEMTKVVCSDIISGSALVRPFQGVWGVLLGHLVVLVGNWIGLNWRNSRSQLILHACTHTCIIIGEHRTY